MAKQTECMRAKMQDARSFADDAERTAAAPGSAPDTCQTHTSTEEGEAPLSLEEKMRMLQDLAATCWDQLTNWLASNYTGGDRYLAEEAVQEAFASAVRYLSKVNRPGRAFMQKCAVNSLRTLLRRKRPQVVPIEDTVRLGRTDADLDLVLTRIDVENLMRHMRPQDREVFRLRCAGYEYEQIAKTLGISIGTVKSRLHRCRKIHEQMR